MLSARRFGPDNCYSYKVNRLNLLQLEPLYIYRNVLEYICDKILETKMLFLHVPFCMNMTSPEDFCERIWKGIENCC